MSNPVAIWVENPSGDEWALSKVNSAISLLNNQFNSLTDGGKLGALSVWTISIDGGSGKSYMDVAEHTFHFVAHEINSESVGYVAANIIHDGYHAAQNMIGTAYYGIQAEKNATRIQLDNAIALGLGANEVNFLTDYRNSPTAIQERLDEPINVFDGFSWGLTTEIDWNGWTADAFSWASAEFETWLSATEPGYWDLEVGVHWESQSYENLSFPNLFH